jgi:prepilin-type N-terminal cleavage/methylation domain-containing protein
MTRARGDAGFTVTEMLVTIVIMGVAIGPIVAAIFLGIRTEGDIQVRLAQNNSAHLLDSYFGPDVQNALAVATNASESGSICGGAAATVGLLLTSELGGRSVSYSVDPTDPRILRRRECAAGAPVGPNPGIAVIRNLDPAQPPIYGCAPNANCSDWQTVSISVHQIGRDGRNPYVTSLQAGRRTL